VVVATEAFAKLVKVTLSARKTPEALAVVVEGNPERLDSDAVTALADRVFDETAIRLTGGAGRTGQLIR
jgi:hypothetical protein